MQVARSSKDLTYPILDHIRAPIKLGELELVHEFVVVESLVAPVILGIDFLHNNALVLDFTETPVRVRTHPTPQSEASVAIAQLLPMYQSVRKEQARACAIAEIEEHGTDIINECAIPMYQKATSVDLPECPRSSLMTVVHKHQHLFRTTPDGTNAAHHFIPTTGNPVKVPPRRILAHYREEVEQQINAMLEQGIIEESSSPWMAPAVFVREKSGDLRLCVDYRELNKRTTKDAYPLPLPDEVQDQLAGSTMFSTLDLQSGYWQVPVSPGDQEKTAFCPGPGTGLFQFRRMPFSLTGAPSTFQHLMDKVLRGLPFVTIYLNDILVHSATDQKHCQHLQEVFTRITAAGLTLRGRKCHIDMTSVSYLGHAFSETGMVPDPKKVQAVQDWPVPTDSNAVRQFLGLASYHRRYILRFADIAAPLHALTKKGMSLTWTPECAEAFLTLKNLLLQAPVLAYPRFSENTGEFVL